MLLQFQILVDVPDWQSLICPNNAVPPLLVQRLQRIYNLETAALCSHFSLLDLPSSPFLTSKTAPSFPCNHHLFTSPLLPFALPCKQQHDALQLEGLDTSCSRSLRRCVRCTRQHRCIHRQMDHHPGLPRQGSHRGLCCRVTSLNFGFEMSAAGETTTTTTDTNTSHGSGHGHSVVINSKRRGTSYSYEAICGYPPAAGT